TRSRSTPRRAASTCTSPTRSSPAAASPGRHRRRATSAATARCSRPISARPTRAATSTICWPAKRLPSRGSIEHDPEKAAMTSRIMRRVRDLQARYGDALLTSLTIQLLLMMVVVAPLRAAGIGGQEAVGLVLIVTLMLNSLVLSGSLTTFVMMLAAFAMNAAAVIRRAEHASIVNVDLLAAAWLILGLTLGWIVAHAVFGPGRVNYHRVIGAI